jgi:hypothetical protein
VDSERVGAIRADRGTSIADVNWLIDQGEQAATVVIVLGLALMAGISGLDAP